MFNVRSWEIKLSVMSNIDIFQNNDLATEAQSDFCTREEAIARY